MSSRYALVLVQRTNQDTLGICQLMRIYETEGGPYCTPANLTSIDELEEAFTTVKGEGINTWFFDNGTFNHDHVQNNWAWVRKAPGTFYQPSEPKVATYCSD